MASVGAPSAGRWVPQVATPAAPIRPYAIQALSQTRRWRIAGGRERTKTAGGGIGPLPAFAAAVSSSSTQSSPTSATSLSLSLPEVCLLVDAAEARALGGVRLNSLVLIPARRKVEEGEEQGEGVDEEEDEQPEVVVVVLRSSDSLDLASTARSLGWPSAVLAPRNEVPRLLGFRFAPGGVPPLGHVGLRATLVCSRVVESEEEEEEEGEKGGGSEGSGSEGTVFVAGGSDPSLRLVFTGREALVAALEAEGAVVVRGLGIQRPQPLLPPLPPPAPSPPTTTKPPTTTTPTTTSGDEEDGGEESGRENDDLEASSSFAPVTSAVYSLPQLLFVDDAAGVHAAAEILLPSPAKSSRSEEEEEEALSSSSSSSTEKNESGGNRCCRSSNSGSSSSSGSSGSSGSSSSSSGSSSSSSGGSSSSSGGSSSSGSNRSNRQRWHFLGLDAEWVPERESGTTGRHPVETLQLATREAAVVLDVAALSRSREGSEALVELLASAANAGTGGSDIDNGGGVRVLFLGHSARQDLVRLARTIAEASAARGEGGGGGVRGARGGGGGGEGGGGESDEKDESASGGEASSSPPPLPLLTLPNLPVHAVDLPALARWAFSPPGAVVPAGKLPGGHGLANLVRTFLNGASLSKELQRSDWGTRPLSPDQLRYAAADAHACVRVAERILGELRPELASTRKRAAAHSGGLSELDGGFSRSGARSPGGGPRGGRRGTGPSPSSSALPLLAPGPARDSRRAAGEEERRALSAAWSRGQNGGGGCGELVEGSSPPLFASPSSTPSRGPQSGARRATTPAERRPWARREGPRPTTRRPTSRGPLRNFPGRPLPGKGGRGLAVAAALGLLEPGESLSSRGGSNSGRGGGDNGSETKKSSSLVVPRFDRGGVARLKNACVLFVNLDADGGGGASRYPNEFIREGEGEGRGKGLRLTWFPSPWRGESCFSRRLVLKKKEEEANKQKNHFYLFLDPDSFSFNQNHNIKNRRVPPPRPSPPLLKMRRRGVALGSALLQASSREREAQEQPAVLFPGEARRPARRLGRRRRRFQQFRRRRRWRRRRRRGRGKRHPRPRIVSSFFSLPRLSRGVHVEVARRGDGLSERGERGGGYLRGRGTEEEEVNDDVDGEVKREKPSFCLLPLPRFLYSLCNYFLLIAGRLFLLFFFAFFGEGEIGEREREREREEKAWSQNIMTAVDATSFALCMCGKSFVGLGKANTVWRETVRQTACKQRSTIRHHLPTRHTVMKPPLLY